MKLKKKLIVFDLESTGAWVEKDKIVEIAMIKLSPEGNREEYVKRVNPGVPIPPVVSELIGITDADIKEEPPFKKIAQDVIDFIEDADFGGFNCERFDLPMLMREIQSSGKKLDMTGRKIFDAQKVFHYHEKRDLTAAYKFYCDKSLENAHTAMADTQATLEILEQQIVRYIGEEGVVEDLGQFDYKMIAEFYDPDRRFRWWNGRLYMMFGKYAKRYSLQEVVEMDKGYLQWILSADFSPEVKTLVENALIGKFPVYAQACNHSTK